MRTMLRALANPGSATHAENTVVQVLCSDGLPLETICTFACGRYPILVESEPFDAEGCPGALDWLLRTNLPLMQAVRHHRAGDATKAMAAFGKGNNAEELWAGTRYRVGSDSYMLGFHGFGPLAHVDECIAVAEKLFRPRRRRGFLELDCTPQPTRAGEGVV